MPLLENVVGRGGEGLMLHHKDSLYRQGRSAHLLKVKKFFFLENMYKAIALSQEDIEVEIGIIINPTFLKKRTLINKFKMTETKDI